MNTRIYAPGVIQVFKAPLRQRIARATRTTLAFALLLGLACAFGAASAWLIAGAL